MSAVSAVLLVIIMSGRFIKYLAQAAQGLLDPGLPRGIPDAGDLHFMVANQDIDIAVVVEVEEAHPVVCALRVSEGLSFEQIPVDKIGRAHV